MEAIERWKKGLAAYDDYDWMQRSDSRFVLNFCIFFALCGLVALTGYFGWIFLILIPIGYSILTSIIRECMECKGTTQRGLERHALEVSWAGKEEARDPGGPVEETSHLCCQRCRYNLGGLLIGARRMPLRACNEQRLRQEERRAKILAGEIEDDYWKYEHEVSYSWETHPPVQSEVVVCPECSHPNILRRHEDHTEWYC